MLIASSLIIYFNFQLLYVTLELCLYNPARRTPDYPAHFALSFIPTMSKSLSSPTVEFYNRLIISETLKTRISEKTNDLNTNLALNALADQEKEYALQRI